jgi:glycerate kinase
MTCRELLDALSAPGVPAAGTALAYAGAMAAALVALAAPEAEARAQARACADRFLELADRDADAYAAYLAATGTERARAREAAVALPLEIATEARALHVRAAALAGRVPAARAPDLAAALDLLRAVARAAARLARANAATDEPNGEEALGRARALERWAEAADEGTTVPTP